MESKGGLRGGYSFWVVRVLLVGWGAGWWDGIFSRLRLFSLPMRWGMEVFGTMTGVLNISCASLGLVLLTTSVRPLALAHYHDATGGGRLHLIQVSGHPCVSTGFGGVAEG
jgi:hypothetical protein